MIDMELKRGTVLKKDNVLYMVKEVRDNIVVAWLCYGEEDGFAIIRSVTRHIGPTDIKSFVIVGEAEAIAG